MKQKFKLGLDFHGVITRFPIELATLAELIVSNGGEVHVITGSEDDEVLMAQLRKNGFEPKVHFTHIFSVTSHLIDNGHTPERDKNGEPFFNEASWDVSKSQYCSQVGITLHVDDSPICE